MSKKLYTPKQALNNIRNNYFNSERSPDYGLEYEWFNIIETALKEQEEDKKLLNEQAKSNRYLMEQIKQSQKKIKALEIIKEKEVNTLLVMNVRDYNEYCRYMSGSFEYEPLTEQEYDLLREVLL